MTQQSNSSDIIVIPAVQEYFSLLGREGPLSILFILDENSGEATSDKLKAELPSYLRRRIPGATLSKWTRELTSIGAIERQGPLTGRVLKYNLTEIGRQGIEIYSTAVRNTLPLLRAHLDTQTQKLFSPVVYNSR